MTRKIVSEMTYNVSMGTLNPTIPYRHMTDLTDWPSPYHGPARGPCQAGPPASAHPDAYPISYCSAFDLISLTFDIKFSICAVLLHGYRALTPNFKIV